MNPAEISKGQDYIQMEIRPKHTKMQMVYVAISIILLLVLLLVFGFIYFRMNKGDSVFFGFMEILICTTIALIAFFTMLRSWIWSSKGKEVVHIYKNKILYYRSMYFYKEGKVEQPFRQIEILFRKDDDAEKKEPKKYEEDLVDDLILEEEIGTIGFKLDQGEVISMYLPTIQSKIRELDAAVRVLRYGMDEKK